MTPPVTTCACMAAACPVCGPIATLLAQWRAGTLPPHVVVNDGGASLTGGVGRLPAAAAPPPVCVHLGDELTGAERQRRGLPHARRWHLCAAGVDHQGGAVCSCRGCGPGCPKYAAEAAPPGSVTLNMGAGGLGDGINGLLAVCGLKADGVPHVVYKVGSKALPFVKLFDGPDIVSLHDFDKGGHLALRTGDRQLNTGYLEELATGGELPRWERYRRNAGASRVRVPTLKDRDLLLSHGADLAGHVALFPFSAGSDREWSLPHWLALEAILHAAGIPTVVFDAGASPLAHFKGVRLHGQPAERVAGAILNCAAAVGNDSGLTHLSATLGTPTIALCGPTRGSAIFGGYPAASVLQAPLPCSGCYGRPPIHKGKHCQPHCPAMSAIRPEEVVRTIREVARNG